MAQMQSMVRATDFEDLSLLRKESGKQPFMPRLLTHVYVKLDFKHQYENASNVEDAKGFLRSVARAAIAAQIVASIYDGVLLEVQGSFLHVGLPAEAESVRKYAADLHRVYRGIFSNNTSRVEGWRMTADSGKTMVVAGRGVHGDDSWVSLGNSANRPAKYLYEQLELAEERRNLRRFYLGIYNSRNGSWVHVDLEELENHLMESRLGSIIREIRGTDLRINYVGIPSASSTITAQALPIDPTGSPSTPTADAPHAYFGWVMRTDLDGFTSRVEECFDNNSELIELATEFYRIMDAAAGFTEMHHEVLAQLPWAGDNFTAAAVFPSKAEYDEAVPTRLIELSLDFEKEMKEDAVNSGFGGWAHGVAGGVVHGNAGGNVYLAGIEANGRRFLVGAGEGFGRSAQAFGDINPAAGEMVVYNSDWERLDDGYKRAFTPATTRRNQESSLYCSADTDSLVRKRAREASKTATTIVTFPGNRSREVPVKQYSP